MSDRDEIREMVAKSRAEQGLPPTVQDPVALEHIRAIFKSATPPPRPGCQCGSNCGCCCICEEVEE